MQWSKAVVLLVLFVGCYPNPRDGLETVLADEEGLTSLSWYELEESRRRRAVGVCRKTGFKGERCRRLLALRRLEAVSARPGLEAAADLKAEIRRGDPGSFTVGEIEVRRPGELEIRAPACGLWHGAISEGFSCDEAGCRRSVKQAGEVVVFGFYERVRCAVRGERPILVKLHDGVEVVVGVVL